MAADISRIRSNPLLDFAGVELKQGGVLLDADFNELVAVIDRRLRATASDVLGPATVSSTTPDAFKIGVQAGTLTIGKGRMYVHGLLAECHGGPSDNPARKQLDPLMGEPTYPDPLTFPKQPFLSVPPTLPTSGRHLVYLDAWQREVTHIERPDLVEIAVGVETSSRKQTVWQVRVLANAAGTSDCATADGKVPGWATVIAASVARLTTGTYQAPPGSGDPCELPPTGGYRGLENQTYRVEIHDPGLPGAGATFKWSRDNASVASRVASIVSSVDTPQQSRTVLELVSLGRDDVLCFNTNDWVEITDDVREQAQRSGEMRRVTVDNAARTITFSPVLPADLLPTGALPDTAFAAARNLRVRRWDQKGQVLRVNANGSTSLHQDLDAGATGVITVPAGGGTLLLENGVTATFTAAAGIGRFRAADHWVFAARTTDATVEQLVNEPPRGIHHHYARLGFWDVATGQVSDCRHQWPPVVGDHGDDDCGCCTACVTPQSHSSGAFTIQAAVDQVRERKGGTVCIAQGEYLLDAPVDLTRCESLRVRGEGPATLLLALKGGAFRLKNCTAVTIEELAILSAGDADAIHAETVLGLSLQRLVVLVFGDRTKTAAIGFSRIVAAAAVRDNLILAPLGIAAGDFDTVSTAPASLELRSGFLMCGSLRIEDNVMACARCGVDMSGLVLHVMANEIRGNEIVGCLEDAVRLLGLNAPTGSMRVSDNMISVHGNGVTAGVDGLWIEGNKLLATRATGNERHTGAGIRLMAGLDSNGPDQCQLLSNQIRGFEGGGVLAGARSAELIIKLNIISRCGYGIWLQDESAAGHASIENNHLSDIGMDTVSISTAAIAVSRVDTAAVSGNTIVRVGLKAEQAPLVAGIFAVGVGNLRLAGNSLTDIGPPGGNAQGISAGVAVAEPFEQASVAHNQIDRESTPLSQGAGRFQALWIDELNPATGGGMGLGSGHLAATAGPMTVVFGSSGTYVATQKEGDALGNASVQGNMLAGRGLLPVARVLVHGDCLFSDNRCELRGDGKKNDAVQLRGATAIVNANRVRGGEVSIRIDGQTRSLAVLGNITTGAIDAPAPWPGPWAQLNARG